MRRGFSSTQALSDISQLIERIRQDSHSNREAIIDMVDIGVYPYRKFRIVQAEGDREVARNIDFYNLDAIISVGYRVNSVRATQFRQWATQVLREFAIKGYVLDKAEFFPSRPNFLSWLIENIPMADICPGTSAGNSTTPG